MGFKICRYWRYIKIVWGIFICIWFIAMTIRRACWLSQGEQRSGRHLFIFSLIYESGDFCKTSCICEHLIYGLKNTDKRKRQLDSMSWNNRICSYLLTDFNQRWTNWYIMLSMRPIIHRLHFLQICKTSPLTEKCRYPRR